LKNTTIIAFVFIIIIILWYASSVYIDNLFPVGTCDYLANRGTYGDKFGAINSLFAGLAFTGIIFTILLQRQELKLQRQELSSTRKVFEIQNEMLSKEKFENTYFQMLNLFHLIVNSLDVKSSDSTENLIKTGRDSFQIFYNEIEKNVNDSIKVGSSNIFSKSKLEEIKESLEVSSYIDAYGMVYDKYKSDLSHYFRTLYHIIKFIDNSEIQTKGHYTSIARAQLSSYEQILLFYNCLHENGNEKFKPLIEKYALFKNIDSSLLFSKTHLKEFDDSAYGHEDIKKKE